VSISRTRQTTAAPADFLVEEGPVAALKKPSDVQDDRHAEDALLDLTNRSDIVIDPFLGSGSTLIAADKTGCVCRGSSSTRSMSTDRAPL
jgi:hypothetical protein